MGERMREFMALGLPVDLLKYDFTLISLWMCSSFSSLEIPLPAVRAFGSI